MKSAMIVLVTAGDADSAGKIAHGLVQSRLAACVNIIPGIRSVYRWKGEVADEGELLLVIKTRRELFEALKEKAIALHPYELPEVIGMEIQEGHPPYLAWIASETGPE